MSSTNAAHDIDYLSKRVRTAGQRLFVRGISYGTHLSIRYMNVNPTDATGIIPRWPEIDRIPGRLKEALVDGWRGFVV